MPQPNAFMPIWPPAADNDFSSLPEVRGARKMYHAQKQCLGQFANQAQASQSAAETHYLSQEIATLLHNISGTAAYFGDRALGTSAGALEQPVRGAFTAKLLRPYCLEILALLDWQEDD